VLGHEEDVSGRTRVSFCSCIRVELL
jgi:hypothetical protein